MMQVIQGELSQMEERYRLDVTVRDYLKFEELERENNATFKC